MTFFFLTFVCSSSESKCSWKDWLVTCVAGEGVSLASCWRCANWVGEVGMESLSAPEGEGLWGGASTRSLLGCPVLEKVCARLTSCGCYERGRRGRGKR